MMICDKVSTSNSINKASFTSVEAASKEDPAAPHIIVC